MQQAVQPTPSKRIVICCDGTWCGPRTGTKTNTKILADSFASAEQGVEIDMSQAQRYGDCFVYYNRATDTHVLYMPGIGTSSSFTGYLVDAVLAVEIRKCCTTAYKFIVEHFGTTATTPTGYQTRAYLFGHSRGAFTVRSVAGMVRNCGILDLNIDGVGDHLDALVEEVYTIYTSKDHQYSPSHDATRGFRQLCSHHDPGSDRLAQPPIEFMGLLDTVGALGVPKLNSGPGVAYEFYDTDVSRDVLHVWQVLALHDRLTVFTPCHITRKVDGQAAAAATQHTLEEVWMPGSHYDVGRQKFVFLRNVPGWEGLLSKVNRFLDPLCINITPNKELADLALLEVLRALHRNSADAHEMLPDNPLNPATNKLAEPYASRTNDMPQAPAGLLDRSWGGYLAYCAGRAARGVLRARGVPLEDVSQDAYDSIAGRLGSSGMLLVGPVLMPGIFGRIVTTVVKNLVTTCLPIVLEDRHIPLYTNAQFVSTTHLVDTNYKVGPEGDFHSHAFATYCTSSGRDIDDDGVPI